MDQRPHHSSDLPDNIVRHPRSPSTPAWHSASFFMLLSLFLCLPIPLGVAYEMYPRLTPESTRLLLYQSDGYGSMVTQLRQASAKGEKPSLMFWYELNGLNYLSVDKIHWNDQTQHADHAKEQFHTRWGRLIALLLTEVALMACTIILLARSNHLPAFHWLPAFAELIRKLPFGIGPAIYAGFGLGELANSGNGPGVTRVENDDEQARRQ